MLMVLVGIIGLTQLPLEQFPEIAPPTVRIMASYTGANAETVQKSVIVPLEEAINGVEGMMYMTSSASNNGKEYIVEEGLNAGDTIIAEGAGLLREGVEIK